MGPKIVIEKKGRYLKLQPPKEARDKMISESVRR